MGKYWRVIGHYTGESQTYEALNGAFQASPYTADEACTLKGIRVITSGEAATSLTEAVQYRLSSTNWKPNVVHIVGVGNGLRTAPATPQRIVDFDMNQPMIVGVPLTIEARHNVATAVTHNSLLLGLFES
jgi:hypothetical protein